MLELFRNNQPEEGPPVPSTPRKCKLMFVLYTDEEIEKYKLSSNLKRRRDSLRQLFADDFKRENCELNLIGLCYSRA